MFSFRPDLARLLLLLAASACAGERPASWSNGALAPGAPQAQQQAEEQVAAELLPEDERFEWAAGTLSPRAASPGSEDEQALAALCGSSDDALNAVAKRVAARLLRGDSALDVAQITFGMRALGSPYVWPRVWTLSGGTIKQPDARERLKRWLAGFQDSGERRCGVSSLRDDNGAEAVAVLAVDALADLSELPTTARSGQWLTLKSKMLTDARDAKVVVLGPRGAPRNVPTSLTSGSVRSSFSVDRPGSWHVQVMATVAGGPRPVLEALVNVDSPAPPAYAAHAAPGEDAGEGAADAESAIFQMLNAARRSENVPTLKRNARLDAVARAHAQAMLDAQRIGHDVGDGDPQARVEAAGLSVLAAGENVAHAANPARAHRALWVSPSHRGNLLLPRFDSVGVGVTRDPDGSVWVCQVYGDFR